MAKYYVESGPVQLVISADNEMQAATRAFQWTCDQQCKIQADTPLEHLHEAERRGVQMHDMVWVNERGFGRHIGVWTRSTLEVIDAWVDEALL